MAESSGIAQHGSVTSVFKIGFQSTRDCVVCEILDEMSCYFAAEVWDIVFVWICFDDTLLSYACCESGCSSQFTGVTDERRNEIGGR